jgi:hypothetical protein
MEQLQTTLVTFVLLSSAILQAVVQPRQVKRENYIEMASLCCLVLDAAAVQAVGMPTTRTTLETVQNFLLVTNGIVVVVLVLGMLASFFGKVQEKETCPQSGRTPLMLLCTNSEKKN